MEKIDRMRWEHGGSRLFWGSAALPLVIGWLCAAEDPPPAVSSRGSASRDIIISIDTLRPDHLGCYSYARPTSPSIDRLLEEDRTLPEAVDPALPRLDADFAAAAASPSV